MIIKDISVLSKYVPINTIEDPSFLDGYMEEAQNSFIRQYLGDALLEQLDSYPADNTMPLLEALLPNVYAPLAFYVYYLAVPALDVAVTQSGFAVIQNNNQAPASKERVAKFEASMLDNANRAVERLLKFLEKNVANYPEWAGSEAYFEWTGLFINSAIHFNKLVSIGDSRLKYLDLRSTIGDIEKLTIEPAITVELSAEIRQQAVSGTLSEANKKVYDLVCRAIANLVLDKDMVGNMYLSRAVNTILANPEAYPSAVTLFPTLRTVRKPAFENSSENGFYVS